MAAFIGSGSGTIEDPYLITNWAEFISGIAQVDAKCKVTQDIDGPADYWDYLYIQCDLFADDIKEIRNVTVQTTNDGCLRFNGTRTVSNIYFKNWCWKQGNSGSVSMFAVGGATFYNCKFSVEFQGNQAQGFFLDQSLYNCAIDFTLKGCPQIFNNSHSFKKLENCNVVFRDSDINPYTYNYHMISNAKNVAIIFYKCNFLLPRSSTSEQQFFSSQGNQNVYICFEECTGEMRPLYLVTSYLTNGLLCINGGTFETSVSRPEASDTKIVTSEQLKDRDYLLSIGFLP